MRRRTGLVLAASCASFSSLLLAQSARTRRIGLLVPHQQQLRAAALIERLQHLGWRQGENLEVEQRVSDSAETLDRQAAELVALKVDLIVALLTPAVLAARRASSRVPIVVAGAAVDPVSNGLARSLAAPGGNVTGITVPGTQLASKSLELIRELRGATKRIGVLANGADPFTPALLEAMSDAARVLQIRLSTTSVRSQDEYASAFAGWQESRADAVFVQPSLDTTHAAALAMSYRLASFSFARLFAMAGGLLSYAATPNELARRSADYVDRILRGADPAQTPFEQATSYDLTLNLRTAKALGIPIPRLLMLRATELIE
jgi:putative tryptophan/tyrosine transport system substrate-binding protein